MKAQFPKKNIKFAFGVKGEGFIFGACIEQKYRFVFIVFFLSSVERSDVV